MPRITHLACMWDNKSDFLKLLSAKALLARKYYPPF